MPRYDLMHWSQRVRDEAAARAEAARTLPPALPPPSAPRPKVSRPKRPKPIPDPVADELLGLCEAGRLYDVEAWIREGKPLGVPSDYKRTPLEVARRTGFHSLVELLLRHEPNQSAKDAFLVRACHERQPDLVELALRHGASAKAVPFLDALLAWDRKIMTCLIEHGADPITDYPFARAFQARVRTALGCYLDCRRMRPELADALQEQADMALRQACSDREARWVGLLRWIGADPRSRGWSLDDLTDPAYMEDPDGQRTALQSACGSGRLAIVRQLKPDPAIDDMSDLLRSVYFLPAPDFVAYVLKLGAKPNDKPNGGSTVLDNSLTYLDSGRWNYAPNDPLGHRNEDWPTPGLRSLRMLVEAGARWRPEGRCLRDARNALYRLPPTAAGDAIAILQPACDEAVFRELTRTPKMQDLMRARRRRLADEERRAVRDQALVHSAARTPAKPVQAPPMPPRTTYGSFNRERLYEQVWQEPSRDVAKRYGVSDAMVTKACHVLRVPKPPRGYWNKKAAGLPVPSRPPLP